MSEILGIANRSGLFCRYARRDAERPCEQAFRGPIGEAATARDAHEQAIHGYFHVILPPTATGYAQPVRRGTTIRSGRRRGVGDR